MNMNNQRKALQEKATLITAVLTDMSLSFREQLNDPDTFRERNNTQKENIEALEESLSKSFVVLPDGRKLVAWEYEALEELAQDNKRNMQLFIGKEITIKNNVVVSADFIGRAGSDLCALSRLTNLHELKLDLNKITDVSALSSLTKLEKLSLGGNLIEDLTSFLSLSKIKTLKVLKLDYNKIIDLSSLSKLKNLEELSLSGNKIRDISVLAELKKMESLWLMTNQIQDINILSELPHLQKVGLSNNRIQDFSVLLALTNLKKVLAGDSYDKKKHNSIKILDSLSAKGVRIDY